MITTFIYKGTIIETPNLEKKLKRMRISLKDIEIIPNKEKIIESDEIDNSIKKYYFINPTTGYTQVSIYNKCPEGYIAYEK